MLSSLEIALSRNSSFMAKLGFTASEEGFEKMKKELLEYRRKGFRCEKGNVQTPTGERLSITPSYIQDLSSRPVDQLPPPETLRFCGLYIVYCEILNFESNTDFLENRYNEY